ncbi:methionyl-tRNA formyltransferase, partial [Candidatus Saccharibacteria bacterium]|nr:methionyl-tRNA formyltransferase [Candidatus Saccharibacteria bacterium]
EVIGVLSSYGRIIPQSIIDLFPLGIINIHPSLLPLYRGPSPIESAIFNGDRQTGVSIMRLSAEMDAGPVFAQQPYLLDGSETQPQLYEILADLGARMLIETLPEIIDGRLLAEAQSGDATYSHLLSKSDSLINPEVMTAVEVERKVRAHLDFPKSKLTLMGQLVIVTKAHVSIEQLLDTDVACRDGQFLTIDEVIAPSGKRMSGQAYRNGYAAA